MGVAMFRNGQRAAMKRGLCRKSALRTTGRRAAGRLLCGVPGELPPRLDGAATVVEAGWLACDPADEVGHDRVRTQRGPVVIRDGQLSFGKDRMDFLMADAVHRYHVTAATAARHRMMQIGAGVVQQRTAAQRAAVGLGGRVGDRRWAELIILAGAQSAFDDHKVPGEQRLTVEGQRLR